MNIEIRRPVGADVSELGALFDRVVKDVFHREQVDDAQLMQEEMREKRVFLMEDLNSGGEERFFLIAVHEGKIVGTICIGPSNPLIHEVAGQALRDVVEIGTVYVDPDYQSKGIGTKLLNAIYIVLLAKGHEAFCLDSGYKSAQAIWNRKIGKAEYIEPHKWGENHPHMVWYKHMDAVHIEL